MKQFNNLYELYQAIKTIVENKERKCDYFNLFLQETGDVELWVKNDMFADMLLSDNITEEEYQELSYMLYKHKIDVYVHH